MKHLFFIISLFFISKSILAQNTIVFSQENSVLFSNKYILYPNLKTFEHKYSTDDGQLWYGKGTYNINGNKITFNFKNSNNYNPVLINCYYNSKINSDSISIKFFDESKKNVISSFVKINYNVFNSAFDGIISIKKSVVKSNPIKFYHNGIEQIINVKNIENLDSIEILGCNLVGLVHYESNFTRILKYENNSIISKDFYNTTNKRKVYFKIEKN